MSTNEIDFLNSILTKVRENSQASDEKPQPVIRVQCTSAVLTAASEKHIKLQIIHEPLRSEWSCGHRGYSESPYMLFDGILQNIDIPIQGHSTIRDSKILEIDCHNDGFCFDFGYSQWKQQWPNDLDHPWARQMLFRLTSGEEYRYRFPILDASESMIFRLFW